MPTSPRWWHWIRFIPLKLHLVLPGLFAWAGARIGHRNIEDFWNIYVAGGFFLGMLIGIPLQGLKVQARKAAKQKRSWLPE